MNFPDTLSEGFPEFNSWKLEPVQWFYCETERIIVIGFNYQTSIVYFRKIIGF